MKTTYDKIADAMYLYVSKKKIAKTVVLSERLIVDVDKNGTLVGVEMLGASLMFTKKKLKSLLSAM